jgi:hypothetical protein
MGLFDSILDRVGDAAAEEFGGDAGGFFDQAGSMFSDDGDGGGSWTDTLSGFLGAGSDGESEDGSSWTDALGGFLGGGSDDSEAGGGGWAGALGSIVDRFSGDGGEDGLFSSVVDRVSSFLPADVREQAESLFNGEGGASSWAGSLLDRASDVMPDGWQSVANAAVGHNFGEGGFDALVQQRLGALRGVDPDGPRSTLAAEPESRSNGEPQTPRDDFDDMVTGGNAGGDAASTHVDGAAERGANAADDNDGMPDDPTFPDDSVGAPAGMDQPDVAPQPMDDFEQDIHDAEQMEESFDSMFEGLE